MAWVKVVRSDNGGAGDSVYVGGNYQQPAGFVGQSMMSDAGTKTFETLDQDGAPNWGANSNINPPPNNSSLNPIEVTLQPIVQQPIAQV